MLKLNDILNDSQYDKKLKSSITKVAKNIKKQLIEDILKNGWKGERHIKLLPEVKLINNKQ